ncbi:hypothetical protein NUACC21_80470 [Scytonema sp. NUACC21]
MKTHLSRSLFSLKVNFACGQVYLRPHSSYLNSYAYASSFPLEIIFPQMFLQNKVLQYMIDYSFHDETTLAERAEELGKRAMELGLIPSFVIRYFSDTWQFYIPHENESDPLTPEEAYLQLKKLVELSDLEASEESKAIRH